MMSNTTYETTDWEAEALRIERAFGVRGECKFVLNHNPTYLLLKSNHTEWLNLEGNLELRVSYSNEARRFRIVQFANQSAELKMRAFPEFQTDFILDWNGSTHCSLDGSPSLTSSAMLRGLYHLNWLTPEVEAAFGATVSAQ